MNATVKTCFWFDTQAMEAVDFYVSLLPDSRIDAVSHDVAEQGMAPAGTVLAIDFTLAGTPMQAIIGGPAFTLTEAASISIATRDQAETDRLWDALLANGGTPSQCGWLKDRFGLSWQVVPRGMDAFFDESDPARVERAMQAMLGMRKIDIAAMRAAADGVTAG